MHLFLFPFLLPSILFSPEVNLPNLGSPRLTPVASELMDFGGGHRFHATVLRLLTEELRAVCHSVFVQHIAVPRGLGGGGGDSLHIATPRPSISSVKGKEIEFVAPTTPPLPNEETLVEFPKD